MELTFPPIAKSVATASSTRALMLHCGVYNRIVRDFNSGVPLALNIYTAVDAPPGSGLGSSSALIVALVKAFAEHLDQSRISAEIIELQTVGIKQRTSLEAMHQIKKEAIEMKLCLLPDVLNRSWSAKKRTAAGISNQHIDDIYEQALAAGALGAGGDESPLSARLALPQTTTRHDPRPSQRVAHQ